MCNQNEEVGNDLSEMQLDDWKILKLLLSKFR